MTREGNASFANARRQSRRVFARLMTLILALGLLAVSGAPALAKTSDGKTFLVFTSDVHNKEANESRNRLDAWIDTVLGKYGGEIDYMGFCGDMGDAQVNENQFWDYSEQAMKVVDQKAAGGKIEQTCYTTGNHEFNPGNFDSTSSPLKSRYTVDAVAPSVPAGANYYLYCLGSRNNAQSNTGYTQAQVSALSSFLDTCGTDRPIFIMTHFPLHRYSSRSTANAINVINLLNQHAEMGKTIVLLWGHNHSQRDTNYDTIFTPGSTISYSNNSSTTFNFYYLAAGCMSDKEYTGSESVKGKGLVITIDDATDAMTLTYYQENGAVVTTLTTEGTVPTDKYAITWKNDDGNILKTDYVDPDTVPSYEGTPTKAATAEYTYTFAGWTPSVVAATADAEYTATYTATKNKYTVTFVDDNGTQLKAPEQYEYGTKAANIKQPATPTKPADSEYKYTFAGWSPEIADVTANATYTATYTKRPASQTTEWKRLAGGTRYETMAAIVAAGFTKSKVAVLATGQDYPDALVASSMAGALECPVILTKNTELSEKAYTQLVRLGVEEVYVMGGESAVSEKIMNELEGMDIVATRISGSARQATSLAALEEIDKLGKFSGTVVVATGYGFADALSIGPWCYKTSTPILLTNKSGKLTDAQVSACKGRVESIIIVGGTSAVSDEVYTQLGIDKDNSGSTRLAGSNRYETSQKIAVWELSERGMTMANVAVATGAKFPDALAGSALCGHNNSVLLLAKDDKEKNLVALSLINADAGVETGYALGGTDAVSASLFEYLQSLTA